jgi:RNA polymerase sigma-70 factor (ECF subfamily)
MEDQKLAHIIEGCKKGDRSAQTQLYERYYKGMYSVSLRILNHSAEAEDAMQEAFITAFRQLNSFRGEASFGYWLKHIVVNHAINILRKRKIQYNDLSNLSEASSDEITEHYEHITAEMIKKGIAKLKDNYRVILTLSLLEGYDHDEIASILKISRGSTRVLYHRAKEKLKQVLNENKNP